MTKLQTFFRIHTENQHQLAACVAQRFDCFAIVQGTGYWKGIAEQSATVEIIADEDRRADVEALASDLRFIFSQEAVYVTSHPVSLTAVAEFGTDLEAVKGPLAA